MSSRCVVVETPSPPCASLYECTLQSFRTAGTDLTKLFLWESMNTLAGAGAIILKVTTSTPGFSFLMPHRLECRIPGSSLWTFCDLCKVGEFKGVRLGMVKEHYKTTDFDNLLEDVDRHFLFEDNFESILNSLNKMTLASTYDKIRNQLDLWLEKIERRARQEQLDADARMLDQVKGLCIVD